jgi:general secretion pathway protein N
LRAALILVIVAFVATVLVRLPARVLLLLLPADVTCETPVGTVWSGSCGRLRIGALAVSGLSWRLHPAALLRLRIAADLASEDPAARGHARAELAPDGAVAISGLAASVALPGSAGLVPPGVSGTMQLAIDSARIAGAHLVAVQGSVELQQLHIANPAADLGGFALQFAPPVAPPNQSAAIVGQLRDLNGPLSVIGVLQLSPSGSYDLEGSVATKSGASNELMQLLQWLGPPDAQGRRALSLTGTL